jgi:hypothetical protein
MKIKAKLSFLGSFLYFFRGKTVGNFCIFWGGFVFLGGIFVFFFRGKKVGEFLYFLGGFLVLVSAFLILSNNK